MSKNTHKASVCIPAPLTRPVLKGLSVFNQSVTKRSNDSAEFSTDRHSYLQQQLTSYIVDSSWTPRPENLSTSELLIFDWSRWRVERLEPYYPQKC